MKELAPRQKEVLLYIVAYIKKHSYPPTIRDIADHFSMSVKGAYDHVVALRRKNYLKQNRNRSRTLELVQAKVDEDLGTIVRIPIVGTVAAGVPILSEENIEGFITMDQSVLKKSRTYFAVRVRGDSMSGAGIMDGDLAIIEKRNMVENGDIAVAVVDDAFTLKHFYKIENYRIKLVAENPKYKPMIIRGEHVRLEGRLVQIVRYYK
jgi:repressor LexA